MRRYLLFFLVLFPIHVIAQFQEAFDGPLLTSFNAWDGDTDHFHINNRGELEFDGSGLKGSYSLYAPLPYASSMQWEMDVSLAFNPSSNNYARIYAYATGKPSDELFFLRVGGTGDNVSLFQWGKGDPVCRIAGRKKIFDSKNGFVRIKLTMEDNKRWTLYTQAAGEAYYTEEGACEVSLRDIRDAGKLNLTCFCKATSLSGMKFCFDNIVVSHEISPHPTEPDEPEPENPDAPLSFIKPLSPSDVQFVFNEPVRIEQAVFTISTIGDAERTSYADESKRCINTSFPGMMEAGKDYTFFWKGVTDITGNQIPEGSLTGTFMPEGDTPSQPGAVLINEIMANPKGLTLLPETEYVEIYNPSEEFVSLDGWTFVYDNRIRVPLAGQMLPAGGYALLYREGREVECEAGALRMPLPKFPSALANDGRELRIEDQEGNIIDRVTYREATAGQSWELSSLGWYLCQSIKGGTPGAKNSLSGDPEEPEEPDPEEPEEPDPEEPEVWPIEPMDLVFNELLPDPYAGGAEFVELYNRSGESISISGLSIAKRKNDGSLETLYPLSSIPRIVEANGYVLLTSDMDGVLRFYPSAASYSDVIQEVKLPILTNTGACLVLFRTNDKVVIDEVRYSSQWHSKTIKDKKGVSLERIDPEKESQQDANWTSASSAVGYATPGYSNSQYRPGGLPPVTGIELPTLKEGSDWYSIIYHTDKPGYSCRIFIYDMAGRIVARVAENELLGSSGELRWDGNNDNDAPLRPGIYIFYAELYNQEGTVARFKKAFVK